MSLAIFKIHPIGIEVGPYCDIAPARTYQLLVHEREVETKKSSIIHMIYRDNELQRREAEEADRVAKKTTLDGKLKIMTKSESEEVDA